MSHAVDFVLNVIKELSSSKPVLFQRDEYLYVASPEGFGQITYGLANHPKDFGEQPKEILESEDIIDKTSKNKIRYKEGEENYLKAIAFGPDDNSFSLETLAKSSQELSNLSDDNKIRMISHVTSYHSHKYGYGADGIDVWVQRARVMNKKRYLELLRGKEDEIIRDFERLEGTNRDELSSRYRDLRIPDCMIITPNIIVSLPRRGVLDYSQRDELWGRDTNLGSSKILKYSSVDTYRESPFEVMIKLNMYEISSKNIDELNSKKNEILNGLNKDLKAVVSNMELAEGFVSKLNAIHNRVSKDNIEWMKNL